MIFDDFKSQVEILPDADSNLLRELYILHFVNTESSFYKSHIEKKELYSDGLCYFGYLWDCLLKRNKVTYPYILEKLNQDREVLVLWDIHSRHKILIDDYWMFPKNKVLKLNSNILKEGLEYLPEDIYIFDYSFLWTLILTHEDDGKRRLCFSVEES